MRQIYTKSGLEIAHDFVRIVHGGRGDYVEIAPNQINTFNIYMPKTEEWRMTYGEAYYMEYRSRDDTNIMIYQPCEPSPLRNPEYIYEPSA